MRARGKSMALIFQTQQVPLDENSDGVVRVAKTRVTLDTVIAAFKEGETPEEIAQQYPSLNLADVYAVIAYYLRQQAEVEEYLEGRRQHAESIRRQNEAQFDPHGVRDRLMARRTNGST